MKKFVLLLSVVLCLFMGTALAASAEDLGAMQVVNCKQWVSLRKSPSTSARRLEKVPLGAIVTDCHPARGGFTQATYNGKTGYILSKYLAPADISLLPAPTENAWAETPAVTPTENAWAETPAVTPTPMGNGRFGFMPSGESTPEPSGNARVQVVFTSRARDAPSPEPEIPETVVEEIPEDLAGETVLDEWVGDLHIKAVRLRDDVSEKLQILCEDVSGKEIWHYETAVDEATELDSTAAFLGGMDQSSLVMVFNAKEGLTALFLDSGEPLWTISNEELQLSGSISYAAALDGTIYVGGYYGPDPIAIAIDGKVQWRADSQGSEWLYEIQLLRNGLACHYSALNGETDQDGWVYFDLTGALSTAEAVGAGEESAEITPEQAGEPDAQSEETEAADETEEAKDEEPAYVPRSGGYVSK